MNIRHNEIISLARAKGKVTVEELSNHFSVTVQTARRDLAELSEQGLLRRVHGGAVFVEGVTNIGYQERRNLNSPSKEAIAIRCAQDIPDNSSVFINIGTTTEAVAEQLARHSKLLIVTNNINIGTYLAQNSESEVILTGGSIRRADGGLVGLIAENITRNFKFDFAIIGCSGIDNDGDMLDYDLREVSVSRTIISQARRTFVVADASKFNITPPVKIASLKEVSRLYTDADVPAEFIHELSLSDTEVVKVSPNHA